MKKGGDMRLYLKLFLAFGVPFGLLMGVFYPYPALVVLIGMLYGVIMSGIFGTIQHRSVRGKKQTHAAGVKHQRDIEIDMPYHAAFDACLAAVGELQRTKFREIDRFAGTIKVRTGINLMTYGEIITFQLQSLDADTTLVRIASRPRLKTTLIDYGRNLEHVNRLSLYLRQRSASDHLRDEMPTTAINEREMEDEAWEILAR
jgi:hypothetical protein